MTTPMNIINRVKVRLSDQPADLVPAGVRALRFAGRRAIQEGRNRLAVRDTGYWEHYGVHNPRNNAGDTVLFDVIEGLFEDHFGPISWHRAPVRRLVRAEDVKRINRDASAVLVGGGGLLISDTNRNPESGWQWRITASELERLAVPLVVFAIGYNQFRKSTPFPSVFNEHLRKTVEKSTFFGLRNRASVERARDHLPRELHERLVWQPCMTTVLNKFHPNLRGSVPPPASKKIAVNLAFDRAAQRYGDDFDRIRDHVLEAMRWAVKDGWEIVLALHAWDDDPTVPIFKRAKIPVTIKRLNLSSADDVVRFYAETPLTLGMRGHAQMIPFGCGNAIISLISHDKLRFFLDDIKHPEWGVDVNDPDITGRIIQQIVDFDRDRARVRGAVEDAQEVLWATTQANLREIESALLGRLSARTYSAA